jgi:aminopeptidase N
MTLRAPRVRVGDAMFDRVMRTWVAEHRHGTVTTPEVTALAERLSGQNLTSFFRARLYTPSRPDPTRENSFPPGF